MLIYIYCVIFITWIRVSFCIKCLKKEFKKTWKKNNERVHLIYMLNTWQEDMSTPARSAVTFCFERNSERVEKFFSRKQVPLEELARHLMWGIGC